MGGNHRDVKTTDKEPGIEQGKAAMFARLVEGGDQSLWAHVRRGVRAVGLGLAGHGKGSRDDQHGNHRKDAKGRDIAHRAVERLRRRAMTNCPTDPPADARPRAKLRLAGENTRLMAASTTGKLVAPTPVPIKTPAVMCNSPGDVDVPIKYRPSA